MGRKSDDVIGPLLDRKTRRATGIEAALQLFLFDKDFHNPNREQDKQEDEQGRDQIDPIVVRLSRIGRR